MKRVLLTSVVTILMAWCVNAQLDRGVLTGTVMDSTGAVIPTVRITIRNAATGATYETESNQVGQYSMPNLPTGTYQITFEASGFKKLIRGGIALGVTQVQRVDATLEVGLVTESVEVTAEVPRVQTDTPEVGTSLSGKQLLDLPLSFSGARAVENFAYTIAPAVTGGTWTSHIMGSTSFSKETLLDGATVTTNRAGHFGESYVSVESLQEFKIMTSGISAEFGRAQAGIFNFVTKSGANEIHGSAYGALRNEALNANTFVDNARGNKRAPDRKQNYAGSFGGPVYIPKVYDGRNGTFFYLTYERYRERVFNYPAPNRTVPLPEFYEGDFTRLLQTTVAGTDGFGRNVYRGAIYDPLTFRQLPNGRWIGDMFPGNRIPVSRFSQVSQRLNAIAKAHYLPTIRDASGQIPLENNSVAPSVSRFDQHQFSVKADHILSTTHKLSATYNYTVRHRPLQFGGPSTMWDPNDPVGGPLSTTRAQRYKAQVARLAHDWTISPRMLNHFVVFGNRAGNPWASVHKEVDGAKELGIKGLTARGYPTIGWGGGPFVTLNQPGDATDEYEGFTHWGFLNTVSFFRGRHFMKTGFDHRRNLANNRSTPGGSFSFAARATAIPNEPFSGNLTGYSFASYLLGIVDSASLRDPVGLGGRRGYYALFFQDDFKVTSKLTLNLGLRWDFQPPHQEVADRQSSWNPSKIDPISGLPGAYDFAGNCNGCTGKSYFGTHYFKEFGPRFGFAWQPYRGWAVRGAYGIMYEGDVFNGPVGALSGKATYVAWGGTWELSSDPIQPWAGIFNWDRGFPTDRYVPASFDVSWGNFNTPATIDPDYGKSPYIQQWNLNVQRELFSKLVVDIGYVGNKGTRLRGGGLKRVNQLPSSVLSQYGRNLNNPVRSEAEAVANRIRYPYPGFSGTVASALRTYPQVRGNSTVTNFGAPLGFSTYHSLQVIVNRQFARGLTAYGNYVWSRVMSNVTTSEPGGVSPIDYYNLGLEKAVSPWDIPHMLKAYVDYELPIGRGKALGSAIGPAANAIVGGWSLSVIMNYMSGSPLGFSGSFPLSGGWNGATNRANILPGEMKASGFRKSAFELSTGTSPNNTYLNKSLFSDPAPLTLGTSAVRYTQVRSVGTINEDIGLQKNHRIREKYRIQVRVEFLNAFNRHTLGTPNTSVTSPLFGQVTGVSGNRTVQIGARLDF